MNNNYESDSSLYESLVRSMIIGDSQGTISNGKPEHAATIFKLFFEHATTHVLIFCKDLNAEVFGDDRVLTAAMQAINRGVNIRVITQSEPADTKFSKWLQESTARVANIKLKICSPNSKLSDLETNFAVMDRRAFRFEPARDKIRAVAAINHAETAGQLGELFDQIDSVVV